MAYIFIHLMIQSDLPGFSSIGRLAFPDFQRRGDFPSTAAFLGTASSAGAGVRWSYDVLAACGHGEKGAVCGLMLTLCESFHHSSSVCIICIREYAISCAYQWLSNNASQILRFSEILRKSSVFSRQPFFCSWVLGLQVPIVVPSRYHGWMHRCRIKNSTEISL